MSEIPSMRIDFLGLHLGVCWWPEEREFSLYIKPAWSNYVQPNGNVAIWHGIRIQLSRGKGNWTLWDWKWVRFWG